MRRFSPRLAACRMRCTKIPVMMRRVVMSQMLIMIPMIEKKEMIRNHQWKKMQIICLLKMTMTLASGLQDDQLVSALKEMMLS